MNLTQDMTKKNPLGLIINFAVPLMIGNLFQQAYTIIDSIIVGRGIGSDALAAIGAVDWLQWMFVASLIGLAQGFGVAFSRSFGRKNFDEFNDNIKTSFILAIIIGLLLVILAEIFAFSFLKVLKTPDRIIYLSLEYIRYLFLGLIVVMIYNFLSSILRSVGNSRAPLKAMMIAAFINIGLDLYFVYVLRLGIKGAAIATVIAQCFSAFYCFIVLQKITIVKLEFANFNFDIERALYLLKLGLPMAFMNIVVGTGGIIVQRAVNMFGIVFVTGITITNKLYALFEIGGTSLGLSVATYTAQNHGAKLEGRIFKGLKVSLAAGVFFSFFTASMLIIFGKDIIAVFINENTANMEEIINVAYAYLKTMCLGLWLLYFLHILSSTLQGLGNTLMPLYSSMIEFVLRVATVLLMPSLINEAAVYFSDITAWIGGVLILSMGLWRDLQKLKHNKN